MAQFGGVPDSGILVGKYLDKVRVYVESSEDRDVLEKWFPDDLGKIIFLSADHGNAGGGGCQAVCKEISNSKQADIQAAGIVDRDKLFTDKNWDLLWEIDDQIFRVAQPYGAEIHVLLRWELENYLLEPAALQRVLSDAKHGKPSPILSQIENDLLQHCDTLVPVIAASALLHLQGHESLGDGYGSKWTRLEIEKDLTTQCLSKRMASLPDWQNALQLNQEHVSNFDVPTASTHERLSAFLRIVDGKRLIERIKAQHGVQIELRGFLSRSIKDLNMVPLELADFVATLV